MGGGGASWWVAEAGRGCGSVVGGRGVQRQAVADGTQSREIMHVAGQRGDLRHRNLGMQRGEAVPGATFAREDLHTFRVQP